MAQLFLLKIIQVFYQRSLKYNIYIEFLGSLTTLVWKIGALNEVEVAYFRKKEFPSDINNRTWKVIVIRIWQGFVRIDKVRNYKEKRVGLGLAIVRQIVRLHNGTYGIINKEDGVEFYIKLGNLLNKYQRAVT